MVSIAQSKRDTTKAYLHGAAIDEETVEVLSSLGGSVGAHEDDGGDTAAGAVLVVGEHDTADGTRGLGEVFLERDHQYCVHSAMTVLKYRRRGGGANEDERRRESTSEHTKTSIHRFHASHRT